MKYIRTGLTITEVEWDSREEKWKDVKTPCHFILDEMISGVDYKWGDTIEELCDEFVFVNKIGKFDKTYVISYNMSNHIFTEPTIEEKIAYIKKYYYDELSLIKGAIYTDKGLIYVAKMNEKGELELI